MKPANYDSSVRAPWHLVSRACSPWIIWSTAIGILVLLASARVSSKAEFAVTSLGLLPVLLVAWVSGRAGGLLVAALATAMWLIADLVADASDFSSQVYWANIVVRLSTYSLVAVLAAKVCALLEREHERATCDELTGLANRRKFFGAGELEVQRSLRYAHSMAIVYLDLDQFMRLNDREGHAAGDAALCTTAQALLDVARATDVVARLGGDEFAVLLPEVDHGAARDAAKRMSAAVNAALDAAFPEVSASIGVAWFGNPVPPMLQMIKAADSLMYESKCHRQRTGEVHVASLASDRPPCR